MHHSGRFQALIACALWALAASSWAQTRPSVSPEKPGESALPRSISPNPPPIRTERWEEDYRYLQDPGSRTDFFDSLKYIPLNAAGDWYVSLGGLVRDRYEYFNHNNFGSGAQDPDGFNLLRITEYMDLHLSPYVRIFVEGRSAFEDGRIGGPRPVDRDELDPQQMFADFNLPLGKDSKLTFRAGRQELLFGAERLIGPADYSNVRRMFDGFRLTLNTPNNALDAFVTRPVNINLYHFDPTNYDVIFGGVYDTLQLPQFLKGANSKLEMYALYLERDAASYPTDGAGREERYTIGARFTTNPKPFDLDVEADYQWGRFQGENISAYSLAADAGYTMADAPLSPRLFLGFDIASGDNNPGGGMQTFNQLFPTAHSFFGYIDVVARQNIIDLHPGIDLTLLQNAKFAKKLSLRVEYHQFWRQSDDDALYAASGAVLRAGGASGSRSVGGELDLILRWQVDRHWSAYIGYSHFFAGSFIGDTGPSFDIDYAYAAVTFAF